MKKLFYRIFALLFNIFKLFELNERKVLLLSPHNGGFTDSLGAVGEELEKIGNYKICKMSGTDLKPANISNIKGLMLALKGLYRYFCKGSYDLATSKYIFLNDNFMPMANLNFKKEAVIIQLWHAIGAFKKFGLSLDLPQEIRERGIECNKRISYVVCSSEGVVGCYAEAFGVPESKVIPLGSPRTDFFFQKHDLLSLRKRFEFIYPECEGKKLILYAPTFRDDEKADRELLQHFDFEEFNKRFGDEYILMIKLHPQVHTANRNYSGTIDVTAYGNLSELVLLSDILITDYSSICMDFTLMNKPSLFYAFDYDTFINDRQFYFGFDEHLPGPIVKSFDDLMTEIEKCKREIPDKTEFVKINFGTPDGKAAERVVDWVLNI